MAQDAKKKADITTDILNKDVHCHYSHWDNRHQRAVCQHLPLYINATTTSRNLADIWWSLGLSCVTATRK